MSPTFTTTAATVEKRFLRVGELEESLLRARAELSVAVQAHAKHWRTKQDLAKAMSEGREPSGYVGDVLAGRRGVSKAFVERLLRAKIA